MGRLASLLLVALLISGAAILYATADGLPPVVASHFDLAGHANGTMSRSGYLVFMSSMIFGVPLLVVALNVVLPRLAPRLARIPSREYWLAPERRNETLTSITTSATALACLIAIFMIATHLLVVEANARIPPRLDSNLLWTLIASFIFATLVWQVLRRRRFRPPG